MLNTTHPFVTAQLFHHIKSLCTPSSLFIGILAVVANHIAGATSIWKALAFLSVGMMLLDVITGTLRAIYSKCGKPCMRIDFANCSMKTKTGVCTFNSRDLGASFMKAIVYGAFFLICTWIDISANMVVGRDNHGYLLATMALGAIAGREILSNLENLRDLTNSAGITWPFGAVVDTIENTLAIITRSHKVEEMPEVDSSSSPEILPTETSIDNPSKILIP